MLKSVSKYSLSTIILLATLMACNKERVQPHSNTVPNNNNNNNNPGSGVTYSPVAYAGADTTIYFPFTVYYLNSKGTSDPDNNIASYTWRFLGGPGSVTIPNPNEAGTDAKGLFDEGVYSFELTVRDEDNLTSRDTVVATVGNATCTGQDSEIVLQDLSWDFSWIMELNIDISNELPSHSRVRNIFIKRDNSADWLPVDKFNPASPDYTKHTWAYGSNLLVIIPPDNNMVNDTPDIKITYCN